MGRRAQTTTCPCQYCLQSCCSIYAAFYKTQTILQTVTWSTRGVCALNCIFHGLRKPFSGTMLHSTMHIPCSIVHDWPQACGFTMLCRFCQAARAALHSAEPQHPGFLNLALRHRYPLRHLSTAELPPCELDKYLAKVQCCETAAQPSGMFNRSAAAAVLSTHAYV